MRRDLKLWLDLTIYRQFSSLCKLLGINICDALETLMKKFIEEHKDQAPLDFYLNDREARIVLNFTQNNIILAKIARIDPQRWIEDLEAIDPDRLDAKQAAFWKEKLPELILEASRALEEIRLTGQGEEYADDLRELIAKASEILQKLLKKKSRRELIHA
ncbi:MAG: hypothetical protein QW707_06860 [Candidatus Bathyarchaeia archaeon]